MAFHRIIDGYTTPDFAGAPPKLPSATLHTRQPLFNMLKYNLITESEYKEVLDRYKPQEPEENEEEEKRRSIGITTDVKCLSMVGNKFISLVANNYDRNHITYTDALDYLSIKSKNFDKVLAKASK